MSASRSSAAAGIDAPSVWTRALLAIVLVAGFYLLTLGLAFVLFVTPIAFAWVTGLKSLRLVVVTFAGGWITAYLLFASVLDIRRAPFRARGRSLAPAEAPELFAILASLAAAAGIEPPSEVFLTDHVELSVTETTGLFGARGRRILSIGAPVLALSTVEELRAGLAHELGHFTFGDTRLLGIIAHAHAAFRAVLESATRSPFADTGVGVIETGFAVAEAISHALGRSYASFFFWVTRKLDRRAELAADQLAGVLAGHDAMIRLLEKLSIAGPLYALYLDREVGFALAAGGAPTDLTAGFAFFCARLEARGITSELEIAVRAEPTGAWDTHPALGVRIAALRDRLPLACLPDTRSATALVALDLDGFLSEALLSGVHVGSRPIAPMRWAELPRAVFAPHCLAKARATAAKLFSSNPEATTLSAMFSSIVRRFGEGRLETIAAHLEPGLASMVPPVRRDAIKAVGARTLEALFAGALLEHGATVDISLGEPGLVFRLHGEPVAPGELAARSLDDAATCRILETWATLLEEASRGVSTQ